MHKNQLIEKYLSFGWKLCKIQKNSKKPVGNEWQKIENAVKSVEEVGDYGVGVLHEHSATICIDVDNRELAEYAFQMLEMDLQDILRRGLRYHGNSTRIKSIYRIPETLQNLVKNLGPVKLVWSNPDNLSETITVFEIRGGKGQDILPPSRHPEGGEYAWIDIPKSYVPPVPTQIINMWRSWETVSAALVPDWEIEEESQTALEVEPRENPPMNEGADVIEEEAVKQKTTNPPPSLVPSGENNNTKLVEKFNSRKSCREILLRNNYKYKGRSAGKSGPVERFMRPGSTTKSAGMIVDQDGKAFSFAGDVVADDKSHDAFDLMRLLECGGDWKSALRAADKEVGGINSTSFEENSIDFDQLKSRDGNADLNPYRDGNADLNPEKNTIPLKIEKSEISVVDNIIDFPKQKIPSIEPPETLLRPPGILKDIMDFYLDSAPSPQPMFAVATALSIVATAAARGYRVRTKKLFSYTSLYFIFLGPSGSGKDHAQRITEEILSASGLEKLLGPSGYASAAGLLSCLNDAPAHLTISDEIGRHLQSIRSGKNSHAMDAITGLMEVFGRCHGLWKGKEVSKLNLTDKQKKTIEERKVIAPCLNLIGLSTEQSFDSALDAQSIENGFINRLIVVEATEKSRKRSLFDSEDEGDVDVPGNIKNALKAIRERAEEHCGDIGQANLDSAKHRPKPVTLKMSNEANYHFGNYEEEVEEAVGQLCKRDIPYGDALVSRNIEKALRVALTCSLARDPLANQVGGEDAQWAIEFVRHLSKRFSHKAETVLFSSDIENVRLEILKAIKDAGQDGITFRDLNRKRCMKKLTKRTRDDVLQMMVDAGEIEQVKVEHPNRQPSVRLRAV